MKFLLRAEFEERFNGKDLVGLDRLYDVIEGTYQDQHVTRAVYESRLWSLVVCPDLASAQRKLDFEIALAEYFSFMLCFARDFKVANVHYDEADDIEFFEKEVQKWRQELRQKKRGKKRCNVLQTKSEKR